MNYTAEEVRKSANWLYQWERDWLYQWERKAGVRNVRAMLIAYAERIEADESTMPAATACADHAKGETGYCIFHTQVSWGTKLFAHPPAQAAQGEVVDCPECGSRCTYRAISMSDDVIYEYTPAQTTQVDPAAKLRTLADFVNAPDAERVQIGQQVAARVDEMMAEPVAQPADSGRVPDGWVRDGYAKRPSEGSRRVDAVE